MDERPVVPRWIVLVALVVVLVLIASALYTGVLDSLLTSLLGVIS